MGGPGGRKPNAGLLMDGESMAMSGASGVHVAHACLLRSTRCTVPGSLWGRRGRRRLWWAHQQQPERATKAGVGGAVGSPPSVRARPAQCARAARPVCARGPPGLGNGAGALHRDSRSGCHGVTEAARPLAPPPSQVPSSESFQCSLKLRVRVRTNRGRLLQSSSAIADHPSRIVILLVVPVMERGPKHRATRKERSSFPVGTDRPARRRPAAPDRPVAPVPLYRAGPSLVELRVVSECKHRLVFVLRIYTVAPLIARAFRDPSALFPAWSARDRAPRISPTHACPHTRRSAFPRAPTGYHPTQPPLPRRPRRIAPHQRAHPRACVVPRPPGPSRGCGLELRPAPSCAGLALRRLRFSPTVVVGFPGRQE
jgi:hypothetical protein